MRRPRFPSRIVLSLVGIGVLGSAFSALPAQTTARPRLRLLPLDRDLPGLSFEEVLASPELQTGPLTTGSSGVGTALYPRQKREPGRTHTMVFPSCILEVEGNAFRIVEHGDYSVFALSRHAQRNNSIPGMCAFLHLFNRGGHS